MQIIEILLLSIVQGITEFLPVSSSSHIFLISKYLGYHESVTLSVVLHAATFLVIAIYYRGLLLDFCSASWRFVKVNLVSKGHTLSAEDKKNVRLLVCIAIAVLPAGIVGFVLQDFILTELRSTFFIGLSNIIFSLLLFGADLFSTKTKNLNQISYQAALIIGLLQILALAPGVSRSGICITAALCLGFSRFAAVTFAFLVSLPITLAAAALTYISKATAMGVGELTAFGLTFLIGSLSIRLLIKLIQRVGFLPFCLYRLSLGILLLDR